jgi:hypothetical protein
LVHQGLSYSVDIYGCLYVRDLKTQATVYYQDLELDGLMHYNAVPVAASPTLIGERIVVLDNQGTAVILAPGREFKILARNLATPSTGDTGLCPANRRRQLPVPTRRAFLVLHRREVVRKETGG